MMLISEPEVVTIDCPVPQCTAKAGVWCGGNRTLGPMAHERRINAYPAAPTEQDGNENE